MTVFYLPVLILMGVWCVLNSVGYRAYSSDDLKSSDECEYGATFTTISFSVLLLYEIINFQFSAYQANSILFLRDFIVILCCLFLMDKLLKNEKYQTYFIIFISAMAGLLAFFNIPIFFFRYFEAGLYGFDDFTQFRFLYMPLGLFSNEWVTILFCLLPFPVIGLFLFWKNTLFRYGLLLIIGLIVFNIFISFSRSGFLALLLFVGLLNLFLFVNRILSIKKLLLGNAALLLFSIFFAFCFSESIRSSVYQTNSHQRSTEGRLKQWEEVSNLAYKYPVFGIGSENYALIGAQTKQTDLENSFSGRLNNIYIQLVIEKGWVGALLWLCVIGVLVFRLFQRMRKAENLPDKAMYCILLSAVAAVLFREIFFSTLLYNNGALLLFFVLLVFSTQRRREHRDLQSGDCVAIKIRKPVVILSAVFMLGAIYFYVKEPDNALHYATKGLEYERSIEGTRITQIFTDKKQKENYQHENQCLSVSSASSVFKKTEQNDTITAAIQQYQEACRLSPYDAMFQHNLGWLYWMNNQQDSAIIYLSQAIKTDPNNAICHISKGLISELQDQEQAFEHYKQAILLSPDIADSHFFNDLKERNPEKAQKILQDAYDEMLQIQSVRYSSVIDAKMGKMLLSLGDTAAAYKTLIHVTRIHPNLSRPWYYLGYMEQLKGNGTAMQEYYKKSLFLSPFDHLPLYAYAAYFKGIGDNARSDSYTKSAERAWNNKRSTHSTRCRWTYYEDTAKDNVIPQGLLDYVTPVFKITLDDTN